MTDKIQINYRYSIPAPGKVAPPPPPAPAGVWWERLSKGWLGLAAFVSVISIWAHFRIGLDNDHLALLDQTKKMLSGAVPYLDYTDVTPPLIHLIYALPVLMAYMGMRLYFTVYLFTFALIGAALFLSHRMLQLSGVSQVVYRVAMGGLALALVVGSFIHQPFADREHLMMVLATPWFMLYSPWIRRQDVPERLRLIVAGMAAVGFAIKPYFYIFYLATIAWQFKEGERPLDMLRQKEHRVVCGFAIVYVLAVLAFFHRYVTEILPIGWQVYDVLGWSFESKMQALWEQFIGGYAAGGIMATMALVCAAPRFYGRSVSYEYFLLTAAIFSYFLNGGWYYTHYPFIAISLLLAADTGCRLLEAVTQKRRPVLLAGLALFLLAGFTVCFAYPAWWRAGWDIRVQQASGHPLSTADIAPGAAVKLDEHFASHPHFMFFSTNLWSVNLLRGGAPRQNVGRFDYLWPLPGTMQYELTNPGKYKALMGWLSAALADDLTRHKPDMVIVDISPYQRSLPANWRILEALQKDDAFDSAWDRYSLKEKINGCNPLMQSNCAYEVYYRNK